MNPLNLTFYNGDVLPAEQLNEVTGKVDEIVTYINEGGGGGLSIVRLTQVEYDALIESGEIDEDTLYIIVPPQTIIATFVNYNGTILETHEVSAGETPVYEGEIPTQDDEYDPSGNPDYPYIEYTFDGWEPQVGPINHSTTFTATYSQRRYALTVVEKYVRETPTGVSADKHYIMVTENGYTIQETIPVLVNSDTVVAGTSSNKTVYISINEGMATAEVPTFDDLTEFKLDESSPIPITTTFRVIPISDSNNFYIVDETLEAYLGVHSSKNSFALTDIEDEHGEPVSPPTDGKYTWVINASLKIQNPSTGGGTGKVIQYNPSVVRLAPYASTQTYSSVLYYFVRIEEKKYLETPLLFSATTSDTTNNKPILTITRHLEPSTDDDPEDA